MKNKRNIYILLSLLLLIPIGFYFKFYYKGFASHWTKDSLVDILYVIFWGLLIFLFFNNKLKTFEIITIVLFATSIIEILQLSHYPILESIRNNFLGLVMLGNCFSWSDFLYYLMGGIISWFWIEGLKKL